MPDRVGYPVVEIVGGVKEQRLFALPRQIDDLAAGISESIDAPWSRRAFYTFLWRMPDCDFPFVAVGARPNRLLVTTQEAFELNPRFDILLLGVRGEHDGYAGERAFGQAVLELRRNLNDAGIGKFVKIGKLSDVSFLGERAEMPEMSLLSQMKSRMAGENLPPLSAFFAARVLPG